MDLKICIISWRLTVELASRRDKINLQIAISHRFYDWVSPQFKSSDAEKTLILNTKWRCDEINTVLD